MVATSDTDLAEFTEEVAVVLPADLLFVAGDTAPVSRIFIPFPGRDPLVRSCRAAHHSFAGRLLLTFSSMKDLGSEIKFLFVVPGSTLSRGLSKGIMVQ